MTVFTSPLRRGSFLASLLLLLTVQPATTSGKPLPPRATTEVDTLLLDWTFTDDFILDKVPVSMTPQNEGHLALQGQVYMTSGGWMVRYIELQNSGIPLRTSNYSMRPGVSEPLQPIHIGDTIMWIDQRMEYSLNDTLPLKQTLGIRSSTRNSHRAFIEPPQGEYELAEYWIYSPDSSIYSAGRRSRDGFQGNYLRRSRLNGVLAQHSWSLEFEGDEMLTKSLHSTTEDGVLLTVSPARDSKSPGDMRLISVKNSGYVDWERAWTHEPRSTILHGVQVVNDHFALLYENRGDIGTPSAIHLELLDYLGETLQSVELTSNRMLKVHDANLFLQPTPVGGRYLVMLDLQRGGSQTVPRQLMVYAFDLELNPLWMAQFDSHPEGQAIHVMGDDGTLYQIYVHAEGFYQPSTLHIRIVDPEGEGMRSCALPLTGLDGIQPGIVKHVWTVEGKLVVQGSLFGSEAGPLQPWYAGLVPAQTLSVDQPLITLPEQWGVLRSYPNPFNATAMIQFNLPAAERIRLSIFDLLGREVGVLFDGIRQPGVQTIPWHADGLPSGTYLLKLQGDERSTVSRVQMIK